MKKMAQLQNGVVLNIVMCSDETPETEELRQYDDSNPAHIGGDFVDGYFYAPQPFPSWVRQSGEWIPPTPMPLDEIHYEWNEDTQAWQPTNG